MQGDGGSMHRVGICIASKYMRCLVAFCCSIWVDCRHLRAEFGVMYENVLGAVSVSFAA